MHRCIDCIDVALIADNCQRTTTMFLLPVVEKRGDGAGGTRRGGDQLDR